MATARPTSTTSSGTTQAASPKPDVSGTARISLPKSCTRRSFTCCFVQPSARFSSTYARMRLAAGECDR